MRATAPLKQLTVRTKREVFFSFLLKHCFVGHFVHYLSMRITEYYRYGQILQVGGAYF